MNSTIERFGYPGALIAGYPHWVVLLRPEQPTLGSLVIAATSDERAFSALPAAAFAELGRVVSDVESALARTIAYEKINYLMLMMVDPHVHFHVIPRYAGVRQLNGLAIADHGWPKAPQLAPAIALDEGTRADLVQRLKDAWA
ncbi:HIT family protein [Sphingosinicella sp. LHD-64]|uniref:HIT family protein n=1 Tax=Sphingosinicella sp. LHD-64 TaxID=3072139 RepID=UPI00280EC7A1|nr:HIT family protein [Sphingosinicella sp. LHD-64]MDQ8757539.1 HIT family protein [Sphingosinicella sp. LHD-64]